MWKFKRKREACAIAVFIWICFTIFVLLFSSDMKSANPLYNSKIRNNVFERYNKISLVKTYSVGIEYTKEQSSMSYAVRGETKNTTLMPKKLTLIPIAEPKVKQWRDSKDMGNLRSFAKLDRSHYLAMLSMLRDFTRFCHVMGFPFVLYGGTLLGSYRHHGFIPWDDDLDVLMNVSYRSQLFRQFSKLHGYQIVPVETQAGSYFYKFFKLPRGANRTQQYNGSWAFYWPFVDIFFFEENSTHITDISWILPPLEYYTWEKDKFFPLKKRPLEGEMYNVPCNMTYVLQQATFSDTDFCISSWYDHIKSKNLNWTAVWCQELYEFYPFVTRKTEHTSVIETVVMNGTVVNAYVFEDSCP